MSEQEDQVQEVADEPAIPVQKRKYKKYGEKWKDLPASSMTRRSKSINSLSGQTHSSMAFAFMASAYTAVME